MGRPLAAAAAPAAAGIPAAAAAAAFLLLALAALLAASEQYPRSPNTTDIQGPLWTGSQPPAAVNRELPGADRPGPPKSGGDASAAQASAQTAGAEESHREPPAGPPRGGGGEDATTSEPAAGSSAGPGPGPVVRYLAGEPDEDKNRSGLCLDCLGGTEQQGARLRGEARGPLEALSVVTGFAQPVQEQVGAWEPFDPKDAPERPPPESQEDGGSADEPAGGSPGQGAPLEWTTAPPSLRGTPEGSLAPGQGLSHDSAETDLLLDPFRGAALPSPTPSGPIHTPDEAGQGLGPNSAQKEEPLELWLDSASRAPAEGARTRTDLAWHDTQTPQAVVTPPGTAAQTPKPSLEPLASDIIDIDYYDLFDGEGLGGPGLDSTRRKPSDDKGMSWSLHELYDDFTPFDESDFYPTTSFYADGDEEDLEEPEEEEEEEEEEEDGGGGLARDLADENDYRIPTLATSKIQTMVQEAESTSRRSLVPPFIVPGGNGGAPPRPRPADSGRDSSLSLGGGAGGENGSECRSGFVRHNASCKSVCETFPSYCHNGGQCYLVENLGAFCRCNTQDYVWHKGIRCESIITDFQVMCVAVGSAALVVLLLFMMTVFFAKKLYLLKTENSKLRKTKYRNPSELHNDNFSLSTIAEGSHPNVRKFCDTPCNLSPHARALAYYDNIICQDDPNAPHKLQDPLKSCLKEEESFNIQNSTSPKPDNGKGDPVDSEVNCLQNNLT